MTVKLLSFFITFLCFHTMVAQNTHFPTDEDADLINKIQSASLKINSFEALFEEEKTLNILKEKILVKGKMYYLRNNKLRWEYLDKQNLFFIVNAEKVHVVKNGKIESRHSSSQILFQQIGKIIIGTISAEKLIDQELFYAQIHQDKSFASILLTPKKKQMKNFINTIEMVFNAKDFLIHHIKITNRDGVTTIRFTDKKINKQIDPNLFLTAGDVK